MNSQDKNNIEKLEKINKLLRYWILNMTTNAGSGHLTSSLSAVELVSTLFFSEGDESVFFKYDIENKKNVFNDRLIFSKGHASPLFYSIWTLAGGLDQKELMTFRKFGSRLEGHPTNKFPFTEVPTGSLGQGLSIGLGEALAQKKVSNSNSRTWVLLGDGEMAEGQVWEAMELASYHKCNNLIGIIDVNRLGQSGQTMLGNAVELYAWRARSFGWRAIVAQGHDINSLQNAYREALEETEKPVMIIANTVKGKGVSFLEDKDGWHGKVLDYEELEKALAELGEVDTSIRSKLHAPEESDLNIEIKNTKTKYKKPLEIGEISSPRDGYGEGLLDVLHKDSKVLVLDAETNTSTRASYAKKNFSNRFFEMFIAEQNMISVASGLSNAGFKPYVSTFAAFLTRAHDQIRMAQFSENLNLVCVGTHAGVSIGYDGSSQMGLGDIALFRNIFGSVVLAPADTNSTRIITRGLNNQKGISYLRVIRKSVPVIYSSSEEFPIGGSKTLLKSEDDKIVIFAHGVTVHEALKAAHILKNENIHVRIIDMYSIKPIDEKIILSSLSISKKIIIVEDHYEQGGLGEAIKSLLFDACVSLKHLCVSKMPSSGSPEELLEFEGLDSNAILQAVKEML